jgi:hypothetical protein
MIYVSRFVYTRGIYAHGRPNQRCAVVLSADTSPTTARRGPQHYFPLAFSGCVFGSYPQRLVAVSISARAGFTRYGDRKSWVFRRVMVCSPAHTHTPCNVRTVRREKIKNSVDFHCSRFYLIFFLLPPPVDEPRSGLEYT